MTPTDFVDGLADTMGIARTELATVDRALAKAGLRQLARGRNRPDITLREGVQLVCAWAGAVNVTSAADAVEHLNEFHVPYGDMLGENGEYVSEGLTASVDEDFTRLFGADFKEVAGRAYLDAATMLARQIGIGAVPAEKVTLSIEKNGTALIRFGSIFESRTVDFHQLGKLEFGKKKPLVSITASIQGPVLKWIYDNTEGA